MASTVAVNGTILEYKSVVCSLSLSRSNEIHDRQLPPFHYTHMHTLSLSEPTLPWRQSKSCCFQFKSYQNTALKTEFLCVCVCVTVGHREAVLYVKAKLFSASGLQPVTLSGRCASVY